MCGIAAYIGNREVEKNLIESLKLLEYRRNVCNKLTGSFALAIINAKNPKTISFQMLSYLTSVERGFNPDKPKNLAKSVTVE
ncbi:MAG: hypothetical protein IKB98_07545 [Clostridia bacterium]|nr:hypothetical protein [Clostridia bacterium]